MNTGNTFSSKVRNIYKETLANTEIVDIISFTESKTGLSIKLYPAQRFILKVFYSLPLSENLKDPIIIRDMFNETIVHTFYSEKEFFDYMFNEKRINLSYEDYLNNLNESRDINEAIFVCGRRASKTTLTAIIVCYTVYMLLSVPDPHEYFNVIRTDPIGIALVSNTVRSSGRTFNAVSDLIASSKFFNSFVGYVGGGEIWLKSQKYKTEQEEGVAHITPGNIQITSYPASSGVRGASNIVYVIDEISHFRDASSVGKNKYLDDTVYEALSPSILGFRDPLTGKSKGLGIIMSSPNGKKGVLYDFYKESFTRTNTIMINTPSYWINNNIASEELKRLHSRSEISFKQEVMGEFIEQRTNWITDINRLYACFNKNNKNELAQRDSYIRYAGFDLALSNDRSVLALGHYQNSRPNNIELDSEELLELLANDSKGFYIIDYVHIWEPNEFGDVNIEQLIMDLDYIFRRFKIGDGTYDQFSHAIFTQLINKRPSIRMRMESATQASNSEKAMLVKRLINEGRLIIPDIELVRNEWSMLQETVSNNGYIRVANDDAHDDTYSAISTCIYNIYRNSGAMQREVTVGGIIQPGAFGNRSIIRNGKNGVGTNITRTGRLGSGGRVTSKL